MFGGVRRSCSLRNVSSNFFIWRRCVCKWLVKPIRTRNVLPHVGQVCLDTIVFELTALDLRWACLCCASSILLPSKVWQLLWMWLRDAERLSTRDSHEAMSMSSDFRDARVLKTPLFTLGAFSFRLLRKEELFEDTLIWYPDHATIQTCLGSNQEGVSSKLVLKRFSMSGTLSYHMIPRSLRMQVIWKWFSCLVYPLYTVHVSQAYSRIIRTTAQCTTFARSSSQSAERRTCFCNSDVDFCVDSRWTRYITAMTGKLVYCLQALSFHSDNRPFLRSV